MLHVIIVTLHIYQQGLVLSGEDNGMFFFQKKIHRQSTERYIYREKDLYPHSSLIAKY